MGILTGFSNISALLARAQLALRSGTTFSGGRNIYATFGYKRVVAHEDFLFKYLRQDIAQRIINTPAEATWSDPPKLMVGTTEWADWNTFVEDVNPFPALYKSDVFAGLGMYSILLIGIDDGLPLDQPVKASRRNKIIYLQPYLEGSVKIDAFEESTASARFGWPTMYEVTPGDLEERPRSSGGQSTMLRKAFKVHHTRVLHIADGTLESNILGHSRLEPVFNTLEDLQKVAGGSAETFWLTANRGLQVDVDKEMELSPEDAQDLSDEMEEYQHQLRRVIRTRGVKINNLGSDVADPRGVFSVLLSLLSSNTGIPQRVLMGAEAGQLASQQDRANWANHLAHRIRLFAEPMVMKPFITKLRELNILNIPENVKIVWPETFKMSPLERAQTSAQMARSAVNIVRTLETQQKIKTNLLSVEEARQIIAPGTNVLKLQDQPNGQMPPPIEQVDPAKFADPVVPDPTKATK